MKLMTPTASNGISSRIVSQSTPGPLVIADRSQWPLVENLSPGAFPRGWRRLAGISDSERDSISFLLVLQDHQRVGCEVRKNILADGERDLTGAGVHRARSQQVVADARAVLGLGAAVDNLLNSGGKGILILRIRR